MATGDTDPHISECPPALVEAPPPSAKGAGPVPGRDPSPAEERALSPGQAVTRPILVSLNCSHSPATVILALRCAELSSSPSGREGGLVGAGLLPKHILWNEVLSVARIYTWRSRLGDVYIVFGRPAMRMKKRPEIHLRVQASPRKGVPVTSLTAIRREYGYRLGPWTRSPAGASVCSRGTHRAAKTGLPVRLTPGQSFPTGHTTIIMCSGPVLLQHATAWHPVASTPTRARSCSRRRWCRRCWFYEQTGSSIRRGSRTRSSALGDVSYRRRLLWASGRP